MISKLKKLLVKQSDFTRNVMTVMFGTLVAQAIPILISPVISRIYDPDDFGVFTLVISLITFGAVVGTGRYEVALMIPQENRKARDLSTISVSLGVIFTSLLFVVMLLFKDQVGAQLGMKEESRHWLYWLPLFIFLAIFYQVLVLNAARVKKFRVISINKMSKALSMSVVQVSLGFGKIVGGLVWGNFVSVLTSITFLRSKIKNIFSFRDRSGIRATAIEFKKFPQYSLLADSINSFSNHIPVVLMLRFFSEGTAGYFGFTQRILSLPLGLVASSFTEVFRQKASDDYNKYGSCRDIYMKTLMRLAIISIPSFALLALIAPELFSLMFGEQWYQSGIYARILCIMFALRFIASPLSYVLYVVGKQKYDLIWQITLAIATLTSFWVGGQAGNPELALWSFSISYGALYLIYIFMSYKFSKG